MEVYRAKGLTNETCHTFYSNLENLYTQHKYALYNIWNSHETRFHLGCQYGAKVLAKQNSRDVCRTIPKFQEWLTMNCVVNVVGVTLPTFYNFKGSRMQ